MVDIVNSTRTSKSMPPPVSDILGMRMARRKVLFSDFFSFQASGERRLKVSYRAEPIANAFVKLKSQIALKSSRSPGTIRSTEMPGHSLES